MNIEHFTLSTKRQQLIISFTEGEIFTLSYEYLRVFSPTASDKNAALVTHKKQVQLRHIENVGKHGYRLLFDDKHSAIYSANYLHVLAIEQQPRWQQYLVQLKASGHSREAKINITQL